MKSYKNIEGRYYEEAHTAKAHKSQSFMYNTREDYFIDFMGLKGNESILDVGCGSGTFSRKLAQKYGGAKVVGADASEAVIAYAKKAGRLGNLRFVGAPAEKLPFKSGAFDAVIISHLIEHLKDPAKALKEIQRVLKRGGKMFLATPNYFSLWPLAELVFDKTIASEGYSLDEQHISRFDYFSIKKAVKKAGFSINKTRTLYVFSLEASVLSKKLGEALLPLDRALDFLPIGMIVYMCAEKKPKPEP